MNNFEDKVNYFLIGAQKAGTTTFYSWLSQHPEIDAPESIKDFHFFISKKYFKRGYDWFNALYSEKKPKTKINGAVNYIFHRDVPKKILDYNPNAKFILLLRDPVKRAFSAYQFFRKLGKEQKTFSQAIEAEQNSELKGWTERNDFGYLAHGFYYQQLCNWFRYFEQERFLILLYEDLFTSPKTHFPKVFNFLEVDIGYPIQLQAKNVSGEVQYKWLNKIVYGDSLLKKTLMNPAIKKIIPLSWRGKFLWGFKEWNTKSGSVSKKISKKDYDKLVPIFDDDVKNLSKLMNKDLKQVWKY